MGTTKRDVHKRYFFQDLLSEKSLCWLFLLQLTTCKLQVHDCPLRNWRNTTPAAGVLQNSKLSMKDKGRRKRFVDESMYNYGCVPGVDWLVFHWQSLMSLLSSAELPRLGQSSLLKVHNRAHFSRHLPIEIMRLGCFLLLVLVTLAACCHSIANAENIALINNSETTSKRERISAAIVKRYIKDFKVTADEERAFPGITKLTEFFEKIAKGEGATKPIKIAVDKIKPFVKKDTRHPSVSVLLSLLKMLMIVGAVSLASGYIIYRVSNS